MARHDHQFEAQASAELVDEDIIALIDGAMDEATPDRSVALAQFLSCSEGFNDAAKALGGSFASAAPLTPVKRD